MTFCTHLFKIFKSFYSHKKNQELIISNKLIILNPWYLEPDRHGVNLKYVLLKSYLWKILDFFSCWKKIFFVQDEQVNFHIDL